MSGKAAPSRPAANATSGSVQSVLACGESSEASGATAKPNRFAARTRAAICARVARETVAQSLRLSNDPNEIPARNAPSTKAKLLGLLPAANEYSRYQTIS